jgi:hypothetical protein
VGITTESLVDLVRRFVLFEDEKIVWQKAFPDGPSVSFETRGRMFTASVLRGGLSVERAAGVEAVVSVRREDQQVEGPLPRDYFLVLADGGVVPVDDPDAVAALGSRVMAGELEPVALAELLAEAQWPGGGWAKRVVLDPAEWRAGYPPEARLPDVEPFRVEPAGGEARLRFDTSRERTVVLGGRPVLDVARWSVLVRADAPATWERLPVADQVPLLPPW